LLPPSAQPRREEHCPHALLVGVGISEVDAVDGSSTGTSVPWMWALLRLPRFRGASDADDNDNRFRHRKVGFPGSRRRRWRPGDCSQAIEASLCTDLLPEAIAMSGRYRSLRVLLTIGLASSKRCFIRCG